ncbi:NYN domain-containing protein [Massilia aerilata]|uniref:NYN domain-containing protein n=1 Tax=Massilia aerilata TaxID=453817 RepID=A0ABW0RY90_9BURK
MASSSENISMAVFCDFENVALGVRDANYEKFDIKPVLERLLLKGSIVVKKAYCDWDRYKGFKATMHEANFELIEIPHVRQSGKNSADIRMVVDALDLCYTKAHVDTFVIISGDSDFSPLVSKLRENAKRVIGVGVKNSTSDLLVANCDEFIFYDDLVREVRRAAAKRDERKSQPQQRGGRPSDESNRKKEEMETRKLQALEMVVETFDALVSERGDTGKIWASLLKDTLKRRRPDFSETYYGFRTFGNLLEEAQTRGLFEFGRDEKSGTYVYRTQANEALRAVAEVDPGQAAFEAVIQEANDELAAETQGEQPSELPAAAPARESSRRRGGRGRKGREQGSDLAAEQAAFAQEQAAQEEAGMASWPAPTPDLAESDDAASASVTAQLQAAEASDAAEAAPAVAPETEPEAAAEQPAAPVKERRRAPRKPSTRKSSAAQATAEAAAAPAPGAENAAVAADAAAAPADDGMTDADPSDPAPADAEAGEQADDQAAKDRKKSSRPAHKAPSRKPAARARRPAKPKTPEGA